jgi:hypothetical protein
LKKFEELLWAQKKFRLEEFCRDNHGEPLVNLKVPAVLVKNQKVLYLIWDVKHASAHGPPINCILPVVIFADREFDAVTRVRVETL